ncbi:MAG: protein translocase subunit SecD [Candidatus Pacebacteria bacterium]|nr:protein translocase subunit SecD [Candidatus Paceibacterota bacterium]
MLKKRITAIALLVVGILLGSFVHYSEQPGNGFISKFPFKLGLDLSGGTHLIYQADTSKIPVSDVTGAMESLKMVIEARINAFGVAEPIIQTEKSTVGGTQIQKLIVELPGVTDVNKAVELIGKTPVLEFKTEKATSTTAASAAANANASTTDGIYNVEYETTALTGRFLQSARVEFDQNTRQPLVSLVFNDEGKKLFGEITSANIGKTVAIFLDGRPISTPVVQQAITDGKAVISGRFTPTEARDLARDLKYGALPVPISLIGTQSIGASLGIDALHASVVAGVWGLIIISVFLLFWYRLPGILAVISLSLYTVITLTLFKVFGIVLTSAGLAGLIISLGMAVDGNILIFERMKEEFARGLSVEDGIKEGFARAWLSIRDSNTSSIITGLILFFTATSPLIRGFSLVFILGVVVSMFTAITVSRTLLMALGVKKYEGIAKFLFGNGLRK